jgi:hypothetical protein
MQCLRIFSYYTWAVKKNKKHFLLINKRMNVFVYAIGCASASASASASFCFGVAEDCLFK